MCNDSYIQDAYIPPVLWEQDDFVDDGDMEVDERACLIVLVKQLFITRNDVYWDYLVSEDTSKIRRDLSNLGLSLVVDERLGVAWAQQVPSSLRGNLPAARREARAEQGHVAHAALCLRRHWDDCEMRGETDPHVTVDEIRGWVEEGPMAQDVAGDGERLDRVTDGVVERLRRIGLIKKDMESGTYRLLPTVLVLISDSYCESVIEGAED